jgi:serine/threonine protein kinase
LFAVGESIAGRYRLDRLLGSGASSDAYLAYDLDVQAPRVLKIGLRPSPAAARESLEREFSFLKHRRDASFPACFASLACSGHTILVLEYVAGLTLNEAEIDPSPSGLLAVANRLVDVLEALHATGSVCRDLKPQNVLVPEDVSSPWKLIDLSTVCEAGESPPAAGTPEFAAPEVVTGRSVGPAADLYSLGKTIAHLAEARSVDLPPPVHQLLEALTESDATLRPDLHQTRRWIHALWVAVGAARPVCLVCFATATCDCSLPQTLLAGRSRLVLELIDRSLSGEQQGVVRWFFEGKGGDVGRLPLEPSDRLDLAKTLCKSDQPESALSLLEDDDTYRASASPCSTLASFQLRLVFQVRGAEVAAVTISAWAKALESHPKWVRNAARVLHQLHRTPEAISLLRRCLELAPTDGPTHAYLAGLLGTGPERDHHLHEAAFGEPPDPAAVEQLCRQHETEGRLRQAITIALGAARALPQDVRPKKLYADLCLREASSWPTLESELRSWLSVQPDDALLERLISLYARSDKWRLLLDESLPPGRSPETRALLRVARAAASKQPGDRLTLNDVEWDHASPLRWLPVLGELVQRLIGEREASTAESYIARLPESFATYLDVLKTPPEPEPTPPVVRPEEPVRSPGPEPLRSVPTRLEPSLPVTPRQETESRPAQEPYEWVRERRLAMRLTQSQFALSVGSSQSRVSQIERGVVEITTSERQAFEAYFASGKTATSATVGPSPAAHRTRPRDRNRAFHRERAKGLTIEDMHRGVRGGGPSPNRVPPPVERPVSPPAETPLAPVRTGARPTPAPAPAPAAPPPQVLDDRHSRQLQGSPVWKQREESLPPRVDRSMIYRLINALAASRSLHEREVAQLLGIPQRRLPGFVAQVARGLNIGGEPVIAHDRRGQSIALDLTLMQQCFELPKFED